MNAGRRARARARAAGRRSCSCALLLAATLALAACGGDGWRPLPADQAPGSGETVRAGVVHVQTARGLERQAETAWRTLAVRYGDGLTAPVEPRPVRHDETSLTVYGPGRVVARPAGMAFVPRPDGAATATLVLGDVSASLTVQTWSASGQELACSVRVRLSGARYDFPVTTAPPDADTADAGSRDVLTATAGALSDEGATLTFEDCAFALADEQQDAAVGRVRGALWSQLDAEWSGALGEAARSALAPRLEVAALLPVPAEAGSDAPGRFVATSTASDVLAPAGSGLATTYAVGLAATGPPCAAPAGTAAPFSEDVVLPVREVGPDGAPYDEALVFSRPLLERALAAAQTAGLLGSRLPAGSADASGATAALAALWPAETPAEVARLRSDRFSLRLELFAGDTERTPFVEVLPAPNEGGAPFAPLRLRIARLRATVHGGLDELELRLLTLEARGVTVDLLPESDADGLLRLRVAALQAERLESTPGLLSLPAPGAAWIKLLLDAALAEQPLLDLGLLVPPAPVLAGAEWLQDAAWALYLRRPQ